jgi:hypothetical protein
VSLLNANEGLLQIYVFELQAGDFRDARSGGETDFAYQPVGISLVAGRRTGAGKHCG